MSMEAQIHRTMESALPLPHNNVPGLNHLTGLCRHLYLCESEKWLTNSYTH
uniref:Uncharacterized protein n=1 Tax=Anguilla anguilla TaxID=7936 RepID=A0A0E9R600_ANGAN